MLLALNGKEACLELPSEMVVRCCKKCCVFKWMDDVIFEEDAELKSDDIDPYLLMKTILRSHVKILIMT